MKLSVLITTYNLKDYIEETLQSVLNQKIDFAFEILVGDDGSSDGTIQIVEKWQKKYPESIKLFVMDREQNRKYNRIARASRNRINLLHHATGEYVIFLDGDDVYIDEKKLQKQVEILDNPQNSDCVACAHNIFVYWDEEKKYLLNKETGTFKISGKKYWEYGKYFHSDTVMFRNVFRKGFPEVINQDYFDDNIIVFSLLEYGKIYYMPDAMVNYRQLENSSWNTVTDYEKNIINLLDLDIEEQINPDMRQASLIRHIYSLLFVWRYAGKIPEEILEKYEKQVEKDQLIESKKWLNYDKSSWSERCKMTLWLAWQTCRFLVVKCWKVISIWKWR
ncbi:glycosyltransferase family 2 protein [Roseburia sp. 499]|uniref:glycosyltransferase family 2 protein n=1 Tax=Roseburia sp. 499 TaxID=1261634 RepID=UPI000951EB64|nr:glycosyltransferase family 2 protein [Roseburia sp. 499]WVK69314.1 glycosyltransferase family 2 protein [Roseburia sp. 499]